MSTPETPREKLRVVLAEDDIDTRRMLEKTLAMGGYDVISLSDGFQLMSLIGSLGTDELVPPDVILADVRMPYFTGLEALYAVQRTVLWAPVILMSAFCDEATKFLAQHGGASALLPKPIDPARLLATLAAVRSFDPPQEELP